MLSRLGRSRDALDVIDEARRKMEELGETTCTAEALRVRGEILAASGEPVEGAAAIRDAIEMARAQGAEALASHAQASMRRILASAEPQVPQRFDHAQITADKA
jgi:hypothetical protein